MSNSRSTNEVGKAVSVVFFISSSRGYNYGTQSERFGKKISNISECEIERYDFVYLLVSKK